MLGAIDYSKIPVNTDIIAGIQRLDAESTHCFRDLERWVSVDQGIAALILRVANSSFYNRGKAIETIPRAITLLGFNVIRSLAMVAFSRSILNQTQTRRYRPHIWEHSLLTAIAARQICDLLGASEHTDEAFIAGIMHDLGKVLLLTHSESQYAEVLRTMIETGCSSCDAEQRLLGIDHCEVGRNAANVWKLPPRFAVYMGEDLSLPRDEYADDPVRLSLAAANAVIRTAGVGGREEGVADRARLLTHIGCPGNIFENVLHQDFVNDLMASDTYQLFTVG